MTGLGIDIGTTTLSAVAIDGRDGKVLRVRNIPNPGAMKSAHPWERRQDPEAILKSVVALLKDMLSPAGSVVSIGLTGQMHGILYVDRAGRATSDLFTWQDGRGDLPYRGTTYAKALSELCGERVATGFGACTHAWFTLNGVVPAAAAALCTIADYVALRLASRTEPLLHISHAAGIGLFDLGRHAFDCSRIRRCGLDPSYFPQVSAELRPIGSCEGNIPVCIAVGDNQASFLGAVSNMEDSLLVNVGTASQVTALARDTDCGDGDLERRPLTGELAILAGSALCGGKAYALLETFLRSCLHLAGVEKASLYDAMNRAAEETPGEGDPLVVDTRFAGTRQNPSGRGAITNISLDNFDARRLVRGTLDGIAEELHGMYRQMARSERAPRRLIGSGNAVRKNPALAKAIERRFRAPLLVPEHDEEAGYGAAVAGLMACGRLEGPGAGEGWIRYRHSGSIPSRLCLDTTETERTVSER